MKASIPTPKPKIANWGVKTVRIAKSKKIARTEKEVFLEYCGQNLFRTVEKIKMIGHSRASKKVKNAIF